MTTDPLVQRADDRHEANQTPNDATSPAPPALIACYGCRVPPDTPHADGCDWARCPDCGEQLIQCELHDDDPTRPPLWRGVDPREDVARRLNWWTTAVGIDEPVEDTTRVLFAVALKQVAWNPQTQRYDIGQTDETEVDRQIQLGR